ncbi:MAG: hypothetical protein Q8L23_15970 [Caulobacter sp.]|nr:hypothetical protein [Caulobacter sp.]
MNLLTIGGGLIAKVSKDWFTSLDGESYAIGKALAVFITAVGSPLPWAVLITGKDLSLTEAGLFYGGLGGAVMALIWGTSSTEPTPPVVEKTVNLSAGPAGTTASSSTTLTGPAPRPAPDGEDG